MALTGVFHLSLFSLVYYPERHMARLAALRPGTVSVILEHGMARIVAPAQELGSNDPYSHPQNIMALLVMIPVSRLVPRYGSFQVKKQKRFPAVRLPISPYYAQGSRPD